MPVAFIQCVATGYGSPRKLTWCLPTPPGICATDVCSPFLPCHLPRSSAHTSTAPITQEGCHFSTQISLVYMSSPFSLRELLFMLQNPTHNISPPLGSLPLLTCVLTLCSPIITEHSAHCTMTIQTVPCLPLWSSS